jgi:hypothetical protein
MHPYTCNASQYCSTPSLIARKVVHEYTARMRLGNQTSDTQSEQHKYCNSICDDFMSPNCDAMRGAQKCVIQQDNSDTTRIIGLLVHACVVNPCYSRPSHHVQAYLYCACHYFSPALFCSEQEWLIIYNTATDSLIHARFVCLRTHQFIFTFLFVTCGVVIAPSISTQIYLISLRTTLAHFVLS